jgi:hypothetical protein
MDPHSVREDKEVDDFNRKGGLGRVNGEIEKKKDTIFHRSPYFSRWRKGFSSWLEFFVWFCHIPPPLSKHGEKKHVVVLF